MRTNTYAYILSIILAMGMSSTYAASNASLWGTIDEPVAPVKQVEDKSNIAPNQTTENPEQAANETNQKTICELLAGQSSLSGDTANFAKIKEALQQAYNSAMPDYKMFLVGADAANDLYLKYRDLYLNTYCTAR